MNKWVWRPAVFVLPNFIFCLWMMTAWGGDVYPSTIRIAIQRDAVSLEKALSAACEHEYHGTIRITPSQGGFLAVNTLDIEDYLLGVIARELDESSPLEALKAQAVSARTHAFFEAMLSQDQSYDLVANLSQAYRGKMQLNKNIVLAMEATRGEILQYDGKIFPAFFHASCGGRTEPAGAIWDISNLPGVAGGVKFPSAVICPYCTYSAENRWKYEISRTTLEQLLRRSGYSVGDSPAIRIIQTSSSGRVSKVGIRGGNFEVILTAEKLRALLGYHSIKSAVFTLDVDDDQMFFRGNGYGHGVGLCQFGACAMARKGLKYEAILSGYFPGARLFQVKK